MVAMEPIIPNWIDIGNHLFVILINAVLLLNSRRIVALFKADDDSNFELLLFRLVNYLFIFAMIVDVLVALFTSDYRNVFRSFGFSLLAVYLGAFGFTLISYLVRKKFGREREIDGKKLYIDTYNSRLIDIFLVVLIASVVLYLLITIWGFTSLLEATGFLGIILAFLALTHSIWAPDPYYCMVILGSEMIEDGDTVKLDDDPDEYIIGRVTFVYTILYDVKNNHRTMMRNSKLIESKIENLSKRTSHDGLRRIIRYKIGYPELPETPEARSEATAAFFRSIETMFTRAQERAFADERCKVNANMPFEWLLSATGDYALEFSLVYYLEPLPNTKLTKSIRAYLYQTPSCINRHVYEASVVQNLSLATPDLLAVAMES